MQTLATPRTVVTLDFLTLPSLKNVAPATASTTQVKVSPAVSSGTTTGTGKLNQRFCGLSKPVAQDKGFIHVAV